MKTELESLGLWPGCEQPQDFVETKFYQQELENTKKRVEERGQQERQRSDSQKPTGRLWRFCAKALKQGPDSPHVHTGFVAGKYIYCPAKVLSLYKDQGMDKDMTWKEFKESVFYKIEQQRWEVEKGKWVVYANGSKTFQAATPKNNPIWTEDPPK